MLPENNISADILPNRRVLKNRIERFLNKFIIMDNIKEVQPLIRKAIFPGRRLRPILFYLFISCNENDITYEIDRIALCLELCHRSSIIIDDIIDCDILRRKVPTFHKVYGIDKTIIISHYIISSVYDQIAMLPNNLQCSVFPLFNETYKKMALGELADIGSFCHENNYFSLYKEYVLYKTSSIFELIFNIISIISHFNISERKLMRMIGNKLGQLYQVYNDIYDDLFSSYTERGIKEYWKLNLTLNYCFLLQNSCLDERTFYASFLGKECSEAEYHFIRNKLRTPDNIKLALNYGEELNKELLEMGSQLKCENIKTNTINFSKWLMEKKCWDQRELMKAGY